MLQNSKPLVSKQRLDRSKWHTPLISVIIPFFNYADHIEDCLLSIADQTHANWECVVVDDGSEPDQSAALQAIVERIGSERIGILRQDNLGQIPAFFAGLDRTSGEFVCGIDPDDRYHPSFMAEMLRAHLNPVLMAPIACCDQFLLKGGAVIASVNTQQRAREALGVGGLHRIVEADPLFYHPTEKLGWHWSSFSSMMFRRDAVKYLRPVKDLGYKGSVDAYLGPGAHMMGGTLFLAEPLTYRQLHDRNVWIRNSLYSTFQLKVRDGKGTRSRQCFIDAQEALLKNGAPFTPSPLAATITGEIPS